MRSIAAASSLAMLCAAGCASAARCDIRFVLVTPSEYVWVADDRETLVSRAEAVERLVRSQGRFERRVPGEALQCGPTHASAVLWSVGEGDDEPVRRRTEARAMEVWSAVRGSLAQMPAPEERFNYASRRDRPPHLYRSRRELGDSASVVPEDFDFSRWWLVRAQLPGPRWQRACPAARDSYMTQTEEERRRESQEHARAWHLEEAGRDGPAVRVATAPLHYTYQGELLVIVPEAESRDVPHTECTLTPVLEPVLIPIPHTRLDWLVTSSAE